MTGLRHFKGGVELLERDEPVAVRVYFAEGGVLGGRAARAASQGALGGSRVCTRQ